MTAACDPPPAPSGATGGGGSSSQTTVVQSSQQQAPAPPTSAPANPPTGASSTVVPVVINGRNGGCGKVRMWFSKVTRYGTLKGHPILAESRFGERVVLRGTLRSCAGKPIVGARLDVVHEFAGRKLTKTGLKSRSGGKLTLILPMNIASRALTIAYRGDLASGKVSSRQRLRLLVRDRRGRLLRVPPRSSLR